MPFSESVLVGVFTWGVVFVVLGMIFILIHGFSFIMNAIQKPVHINADDDITALQNKVEKVDLSTGTLLLKDVDEPTAAMIMAIVSDESGIPLSELCFKSIKIVKGETS